MHQEPLAEDFCRFLAHSPTAFHAVQEVGERLAQAGSIPLKEEEPWNLKKGGRYFVEKGGAMALFSLPSTTPSKALFIGAHTDSPALKLKPHPDRSAGSISLLATEPYGAAIRSSWFNRDLAIAGRIFFESFAGTIESRLIFLDTLPLFIPQLPIHIEKEVREEKGKQELEDQLRAILSLSSGITLESILKKSIPFRSLISHDLFLVPLEPARFLGASEEFLASYRLDNLSSVHAAIAAWNQVKPSQDTLQLIALWDGEEIGSATAEGALSPFIENILQRIVEFYSLSHEEWIRIKSLSYALSVDVAHGYNPNFPHLYDPTDRAIASQGIVIKYNSSRRYSSDGAATAPIIATCRRSSIPYQTFTSLGSVPNGSTVGPIMATKFGLPTVDIGAAIFSMHSIREAIAIKDQFHLFSLLKKLLENPLYPS